MQTGFINAHTHIYSGLAPFNMPPPEVAPENFTQILERVWWKLDRALDEEFLRVSAEYYVAQALLSGTTTLVDHHESPNFIDGSLDVLAEACEKLGMRAVLCYGATERNGGRAEAKAGLAECERFVRKCAGSSTLRGMVALHASFTCSGETIEDALALADSLQVPLHVHMAEDGADVAHAQSEGFAGPLERIEAFGAVPTTSIFAHGIHMERAQIERAGSLGAWFVHNPRSNEGNRVGYANKLRYCERVALGTDGYPANMADEVEALVRLAQRHGDDMEHVSQRLANGVDLVGELFGDDLAGDGVEYDGEQLRRVVVAGEEVVRDGQLVRADVDEICARARQAAPRLWVRMAGL